MMLTGMAGWSIALFAVAIVWLIMFVRCNSGTALGAAVAVSFVFPTWLEQDILGLPVSVQTAISVIGLVGFVVRPGGRPIVSAITALDACVTMVWFAHVFSDTVNDGFSVEIPLRAYGEWVVPYVAGRCAIRNADDLRRIAPFVACAIAVLAVVGLIEMLTHVNLMESVFGPRPKGNFSRSASRVYFGHEFKRAFGPTGHPIFFGCLALLLLPWARVLWQDAGSKIARLAGAGTVLLVIATVISSVSRGPVGGLAVALIAICALRVWWTRWLFGAAAVAAVAMLFAFPERAGSLLEEFSGDEGEHKLFGERDGEIVRQGSTMARFQLLRVYGPIARSGGLLGYGTRAASGFPMNVPNLPRDEPTMRQLRNVDNAYLLLAIRFGWVGLGVFVLLLASFFWTAISLNGEVALGAFPGWCAAVMAALAAVMLAVWMSYDFGFEMLWLFGVISGLASSTLVRR